MCRTLPISVSNRHAMQHQDIEVQCVMKIILKFEDAKSVMSYLAVL